MATSNSLANISPSAPHGLRGKATSRRHTDASDAQNSALVFKYVLLGTIFVVSALCLLLFMSYAILGNHYVGIRLVSAGACFILLACIALATYYKKALLVTRWLLVSFYGVIAIATIWSWGINTPFGILLCAIVITLAGILITARSAIYAAVVISCSLVAVQYAFMQGLRPGDHLTMPLTSSFGDVAGYDVAFVMVAIVSWLHGSQMERSLRKATEAEKALQIEKASLEQKVVERTAALERSRLEELEQMYRFTQFGNLSTSLMHDLANYLTVLTLDIEGLRTQRNSTTLNRAQETIQYIDGMVENVRDQLNGKSKVGTFDAAKAISELVAILQQKAQRAGVALDWKPPSQAASCKLHGDITRFNQVATIFISNAIEAYTSQAHAAVHISMQHQASAIIITVSDSGKGISLQQREHLFKPFHSTKKQGMGIGLFLARQMVEVHFNGTVSLGPALDQTIFTITLPAQT